MGELRDDGCAEGAVSLSNVYSLQDKGLCSPHDATCRGRHVWAEMTVVWAEMTVVWAEMTVVWAES